MEQERRDGHGRQLRLIARLCALALAVGAGGCATPPAELPDPTPAPAPEPEPEPDPEAELVAFADAVRAAMRGEDVDLASLPDSLRAASEPVYVALRVDGERVHETWRPPTSGLGPMNWHLLRAAISESLAALGPERAARVTTVEIDLSHDFVTYDSADPEQMQAFLALDPHSQPRELGVRGDLILAGEHAFGRAPSFAVATNRTLKKHLELLEEQWMLSSAQWAAAQLFGFEAEQLLVELDAPRARRMFRGNELVEVGSVDAESVEALAARAAQWLATNLDADGRLTYHYFPSTRELSGSNNAIRQWEASSALLAWAEHTGDPAALELATRHIEHDLGQMYRVEAELGLIALNGKVKLGALGLAGLALHRHPEAQRWAAQLDSLRATIDQLWHPDGSFTSFYEGSDKEYWNFYPGEAMLLWATLYAADREPELLRKYRRALEFYRAWHRQPGNVQPAFAPWHMIGIERMLDGLAGAEPELEAELMEFEHELAELVISMQQWDTDAAYPDEWGRFYAPDQRWGVPHASSTGVYTWALVSAYRIARAAGDEDRARRARVAIVRGLRSLMQLQFVDEVDMFYVPTSERPHVEGGLRTTVFDNRVRVDNVNYAVLAAVEVLRTFGPDDYGGAS